MEAARGRILTTLLLSAATLLSGITPPALRHAHAEGEAPHDHDHRNGQSPRHIDPARTHHEHSHDHDHPHHGPTLSDHVVNDATSHVHACFFWLQLVIPDGQNEHPPHAPDLAGGRASFLARAAVSDVLILARAIPGYVFACLPWGYTAEAAQAARSHPQGGRQRLSSIPLCDSARGERSGVQLI